MPSLEEVRMQIGRLGTVDAGLGKREISALPSILWEHETITGAVSGALDNRVGMLVATDRRLIFLDKKMLGGLKVEDFPYQNITSISYELGLMFGTIRIFASGNRAEISMVPKGLAQGFAEKVRNRISGGGAAKEASETLSNAAPAPTAFVNGPGSPDLIDHLERLGALRAQGLLTDEEFTAAKARLLA
ncbi:PH domain-containing protein [Brevundimonas aurantiaca]|jgi:hypothetical protein|uniref:PH domain-containing protein n=2 Tax=Brevundimonas aurantiaca TaxID=74316 RepID=UPI0040349161